MTKKNKLRCEFFLNIDRNETQYPPVQEWKDWYGLLNIYKAWKIPLIIWMSRSLYCWSFLFVCLLILLTWKTSERRDIAIKNTEKGKSWEFDYCSFHVQEPTITKSHHRNITVSKWRAQCTAQRLDYFWRMRRKAPTFPQTQCTVVERREVVLAVPADSLRPSFPFPCQSTSTAATLNSQLLLLCCLKQKNQRRKRLRCLLNY